MEWLWPSFVDENLPLTKQQRKAIHREAWKLWAKRRLNVALYIALVVVLVALYVFGSDIAVDGIAALIGAGGLVHKLFRALAGAIVFGGGFAFMGAVLQRWRFAPCVYEATRAHGIDVCRKCGYWLRDLADDERRCPECGTEREKKNGDEPRR
jgi:hypothetical protein